MRSTLPRPFWIASTRLSGPIIGAAARTAASMSMTLVATITSSQGPASAASVVAFTGYRAIAARPLAAQALACASPRCAPASDRASTARCRHRPEARHRRSPSPRCRRCRSSWSAPPAPLPWPPTLRARSGPGKPAAPRPLACPLPRPMNCGLDAPETPGQSRGLHMQRTLAVWLGLAYLLLLAGWVVLPSRSRTTRSAPPTRSTAPGTSRSS